MNLQTMKEKLIKEKATKEKKILDYQKRIKAIDEKITEIENAEIIGIVRTLNYSPEQLNELLNNNKG